MDNPQQSFNAAYAKLVAQVADGDPSDPATMNAAKILKTFSESTVPPTAAQTPTTPTTRWQKIRAQVGGVLDNETTRTVIKALGAFGGVAYVTRATVKRDHVLERTALAQANQRPPYN